MRVFKYKTSVQKQADATALIEILDPFFWKANLSFDLKSSDKILSISTHDEDHSDIVLTLIKGVGFECAELK